MFQQNEKIVCVDDEFPAYARAVYKDLPKKDSIYTVREIGVGLKVTNVVKSTVTPLNFTGEPDFLVLLKEITNPIHPVSNLEMGYLASRFVSLLPPLTEEELMTKSAPAPKPKVIEKPKKKKKIKVRELQPA